MTAERGPITRSPARCRSSWPSRPWWSAASAATRAAIEPLTQPACTTATPRSITPSVVAASGNHLMQGQAWPSPRPRVRGTREVDLTQVGGVGGKAVEHERAVVTRRGTTLVGDHRRPRLGRVQGPPPGPRRVVLRSGRDQREGVPPAPEADEFTVLDQASQLAPGQTGFGVPLQCGSVHACRPLLSSPPWAERGPIHAVRPPRWATPVDDGSPRAADVDNPAQVRHVTRRLHPARTVPNLRAAPRRGTQRPHCEISRVPG